MGGMVDSKKQLLLVSERLVDVLWRQHDVLIRVSEQDTEINKKTTENNTDSNSRPKKATIQPTHRENVRDLSKLELLLKLYLKNYIARREKVKAIRNNDLSSIHSFDLDISNSTKAILIFIQDNNITDADIIQCKIDAIARYGQMYPDFENV
jgi:hypothetical protein